MKKMLKAICLTILWSIFGGFSSAKAQPILHFQEAYSENRISENANRCMYKDRLGFIWIGTIDGLNRYDGYRFSIYQNDPRDSTSISGNYITCILQDTFGKLWIGTDNGLNQYDPVIDGFTTYALPGTGAGIPSEYVTAMTIDDTGRFWVSTYGGLYRFCDSLNAFEALLVDSLGAGPHILHEDVTGLSTNGSHGFWIGYQDGRLSRYQQGKLVHYPDIHFGFSISDLLEDQDGNLWMGTNQGIFQYQLSTKKLIKHLDASTWDIYPMDSKVWINVNFEGIYEWDPAQQQLDRVTVLKNGQPIFGDVKAFFKDERGVVWGSFHGLFKHDPFEKRLPVVRREKGNPNSLSEIFVSGIAEDSKGNLIVLTVNEGLNYYDRKQKQWWNYQNHPWYDNDIRAIRQAKLKVFGDQVFVLSREKIMEFNPTNGMVKEYPAPGIGGRFGHSILKTGRQEYWVGGGRLYYFQRDRGVLVDYTPKDESGKLLETRLYQDSWDSLWAVTIAGIYSLDPETKLLQLRYPLQQDISGFAGTVQAFVRDTAGRFWIGRRGTLDLLDPQGHRFRQYSVADGLPSSNVNTILIDDRLRLWLGTNKGLSVFDPKTEQFRNFDRYDGIQDEIYLEDAAYRSPSGLFYFGGVNGFNVFHPDSICAIDPYPPKLIISDLKIFNQSVRPGPESVLSRPIYETDRLELSYRHTAISFELLALGLTQSKKNQYAFMLEGVDPDWNYVGTRNIASYSNLPRGKEMRFKIKAANHDGIWTPEPVILTIYVHPPYWQTWWFRTGLLVVGLLLILIYARLRARRIQFRNEWLEKEVVLQTAEIEQQATNLKQANEELQQQATIIKEQLLELDKLHKAQASFFTSLSHEFRTPLTLLLGNLEELSQTKEPEKVLAIVTKRMEMSARQLLNLIDQLLDAARLESGYQNLQISHANLLGEIRNAGISFQVLAHRKGLELDLDTYGVPEGSYYFDVDVLHKILNNLLSNAVKYTIKGSIQLQALVRTTPPGEERLLLRVSDTGLGIDAEQLPYIFERFYQVEHPDYSAKRGTGIGLSIVKQLIQLHRGTIEVSSKKGQGTTFNLELPIGAAAFPVYQTSVRQHTKATDMERSIGESSQTEYLLPTAAKDAPLLLICEDNPEIRAFLVRQLKGSYRILEAADGREGWEAALKHIPDLIISDVIMPKLDGFELCDQIKNDRRTSHIPLILLTALSEQDKKLEGLKQGADAYLSKPFHREELLLRVNNLIVLRENLRRQFIKEFSLDFLPHGLNPVDQDFIMQLNKLIDERLADETFGAQAIIKVLGISRTQLFRKLKALTGMSATEYVRDYRLRKAYFLINQERLNISQVIHATGFNSRSYFYEHFRKKFGVAPSNIKKLIS